MPRLARRFDYVIGIDLSYRKPLKVCIRRNRENGWAEIVTVDERDDVYSIVCDLEGAMFGKCSPTKNRVLVVAEKPIFIQNKNTTFAMTRIFSMTEFMVRDRNGYFFGVHPTTWQNSLLGKPNDKKKASIVLAEKDSGFVGLSDDEADAFNIASFGIKHQEDIIKAFKGEGRFSESVKRPEPAK